QHGTAEEFAPGTDLRSDRELSQPAVVLTGAAVGVVDARFERQRKIFREKDLWASAKRYPLVPAVLRIAISSPLENKDRHNGKLVIGLEQHVLGDQKPLGVVDERRRIVDRRAEIARGPSSVLNGKRVITTMPLEDLVAYPDGISVAAGNG